MYLIQKIPHVLNILTFTNGKAILFVLIFYGSLILSCFTLSLFAYMFSYSIVGSCGLDSSCQTMYHLCFYPHKKIEV